MDYGLKRVAEALNDESKAVKGSRILVVGLAYKADVDDERESPSYVLMEMLQGRGAKVAYHDPYVPVIRPTREHAQWAGTKSVAWNKETVAGRTSAVDAPQSGDARQADQVNHRAGAVGFVVTFELDGDLHRRAAKHAGFDLDKRVLERPLGGVVVVTHVHGGAVHIFGQRFAFRDQFCFCPVDKVGEICVAADIDL